MLVSNYKYNTPACKGYTYRPNKKLVHLNPVKYQLDKWFGKSVKLSREKFCPIEADLKSFVDEIELENNGIKTYAFDIKNNPNKYLLFLHGLGQNISFLQPLIKKIISETDYSVLIPEYRGFGKNPKSKINKKTFYEDSQMALDYLTKDKQVNPENICITGHSFGGFIATQLANKNPDLKQLILIASVDSLSSEIMNSSVVKHISAPVLKLLKNFRPLRAYLTRIFDTTKLIKTTRVPTDIIHSENDRVINAMAAKHLAENSANLKSLTLLQKGGHILEPEKIGELLALLSE